MIKQGSTNMLRVSLFYHQYGPLTSAKSSR
jgi:hypothetical protein